MAAPSTRSPEQIRADIEQRETTLAGLQGQG